MSPSTRSHHAWRDANSLRASGLAKLVIAALVTGAAVSSVVVLRAKDDPSPIEGKITLARLRWGSDLRGSYGRGFSAAWNHNRGERVLLPPRGRG